MIPAIKELKNALAYAQFTDEQIRSDATNLLDQLDTELTEEEYEQGVAVDDAVVALETSLNLTDSQREKTPAAAGDEEFDEFEGLGDEEGDEK